MTIRKTDFTVQWDRKNNCVKYVPVPDWYVGKQPMGWGNGDPQVHREIKNSVKFIKECADG